MTEQNWIYDIAVWLVPLVIAIVFHEIAHGWVAFAFGDPTAKQLGRLSPNPIRHIDPIGTIGLPLLLALTHAPIFGWAKPVPVRSDRLRSPRIQMMLVALAGPGMNLLLALIAALLLALPIEHSRFFLDNLRNFLMINVFLAVFNLLPLPPFDGGHVVEGLLPRSLANPYRRLARFGLPLAIFLLIFLPMIDRNLDLVRKVIGPVFRWVLQIYAHIAGPLGTV